MTAGVHQGETAGAIGVFGHTLPEASLAEKRRLLVACGAADGDTGQGLEAGQPFGHSAVDLTGGDRLGQHGHRNGQSLADILIPAQPVDVKKHGAGSVGVVGAMYLTARQIPDQPAVHGAAEQLPGLGPAAQVRRLVQHPPQLGTGKIGINEQSGPLIDQVSQPFGLEPLTQLRRPAALPDNGVAYRLARFPVPQNGGFPLIGDADGGDIRGRQFALLKGLRHGV